MGRRKHEDEIERVLITVPTSVMAQMRLLLMDPFTQRLKYGALSTLTTQLFRQHIAEQQALVQQARAKKAAQGTEPAAGA